MTAWTGDPVWIADVLREAGLNVIEQPGWRNRGHGDFRDIRGVLCHHTAGGGSNDWQVVLNGRPDLRGPLSQLVLERDGTYRVICAGVAWHAGRGGARHPWLPRNNGNWHLIGIEAVSRGAPDAQGRFDWTAGQLDAYKRGCAAIARRLGVGADRVIGHKEYSSEGKIDPAGIDMNQFRREVAVLLNGGPTAWDVTVVGLAADGAATRTVALDGARPLTGGVSHFGGPSDASTLAGRMALTGEPGASPRDHWYCAMRWSYCRWEPYSHGGETWLRPVSGTSNLAEKTRLGGRLLMVTLPRTGKSVIVRAADTGPRPSKRVVDISPHALQSVLGGRTDDQVQVRLAPASAVCGEWFGPVPAIAR